MSNEIKCPHCGEAFTVDESGYAAILNQVRDQEFQREVDARVSLAEKSREQEVALAVSKAEEALRAQIAERDGELVNLKAQLSTKAVSYTHLVPLPEDEGHGGVVGSRARDGGGRSRGCLRRCPALI